MFDGFKERLREIDEKGGVSPRKPLRALLFSLLCPGLGQQYAGHLVRGITLYASFIVVSWLSAALFMLIGSRISILFLAVPFVCFPLIAVDAYLCASRQPQDFRLRWFNGKGIYTGVFLLLLVTVNPLMDFIVGRNIVRAYFMYNPSMADTILQNDLLLVNKLAYRVSSPDRGDIVLITFGRQRTGVTKVIDNELVRRIVAAPGDTIEIRGEEVIVNNKKLEEPYAVHESSATYAGEGENALEARQVPADSYFVLGDNRNHSLDSRVFGFIERERISGKVTKVFWSLNLADKKVKWERTGMAVK